MAGDFHHLPDGRLEKLVLYGDILGGRNGDPFAYREPHAMGKPPGSFADQIKLDMIAFGMDPKQFTTLVEDKAAWRCTIDACAQAAQTRRATTAAFARPAVCVSAFLVSTALSVPTRALVGMPLPAAGTARRKGRPGRRWEEC